MKVCILASGSKGNCVYLEHDNYKILLDIGITFKQLRLKLNQIDVDVNDINAVFITHQHFDHVMGLRTFSNNIDCDFYLTKGTFDNLNHNIHETLSKKQFHFIKSLDSMMFNNIKITFIPTHHDVAESIGFMIEVDNKKVVYITDTGYIDLNMHDTLKNADLYILESNYDPEILYSSNRYFNLKKRIAGDLGHMSNEDSAINLTYLIGENTKMVIHAHISLECNTEEAIVNTFRRIFNEYKTNIDNVKFVCAKQYEISEVYEL